MSDTYHLRAARCSSLGAVGLLALLSNRLTERIKVPAPLLVLVAAAAAVQLVPALHAPPQRSVERLVTVALVCILFDGGMHIGWRRFRAPPAPIARRAACWAPSSTAAAIASSSTWRSGSRGTPRCWWPPRSRRPTRRWCSPCSGSASRRPQRHHPRGRVRRQRPGRDRADGEPARRRRHQRRERSPTSRGEFVLQMGVGAAVGVVGGRALLWFMRAVPLPSEALYPLRTAACALLLYGAATVAHGSGFLAVFVAGILLGDERAPYKREIERFHSALASLGEIVAFVVLGLTVDLGRLSHPDVWLPGW